MKLFLFLALTLLGPFAHGFPIYYDISDHDKAQAEARQRHLPPAWLGGSLNDLSKGGFRANGTGDLQQMAMDTLKGNAVIIFFDGKNIAAIPEIVHAQFHIHDDSPLPQGIDWLQPKVVFTNAEVTKMLGRVCMTEMRSSRAVPLNSALQVIRNNPAALAP